MTKEIGGIKKRLASGKADKNIDAAIARELPSLRLGGRAGKPFGDQPVRGRIVVEHAPAGWRLTPDAWEVTLDPMGRSQLDCRFLMPQPEKPAEASRDSPPGVGTRLGGVEALVAINSAANARIRREAVM